MNRVNVPFGWKAGVAAVACITALLLASAASGRNMERYEEDTTSQLLWWNNDSVKRIWGCDKCNKGDIACSLGSSVAQLMGWPCGYTKETADYYGYLDIDDQRRLGTPNMYKWMDDKRDTKMDYESGIPDGGVSDGSVESIHSNVTAYFVKETEWKGPPYWIHMHDPGPWDKNVDWNRWVMPCDIQGEDWCRWTDCYQIQPCPCQEHICPGRISITLPSGDVVCQECDADHSKNGEAADCNAGTGRYNTEAICSCGTVPPDPPTTCEWGGGATTNTYCQEKFDVPSNTIIGEVWDNCPCDEHPCPTSGGDGSGACMDTVSGRWECSQCAALETDPPGGSIKVKRCGRPSDRCPGQGASPARCSYTISYPLSHCYGGGVPEGELGNDNYQWGCWDCTNVYNETEDPDNPLDVQEMRDFCGWGGTRIVEEVREERMFDYLNYPLKRDASGNDLNDDIRDYKEPFTSGSWFPGMALVPVLAAEGSGAPYEDAEWKREDLVRDRFWRHNATDTEFSGTRPGYCSGECSGTSCGPGGGSVPCQQEEMITQRDGLNRPSSRQHDPCRSCWDNLDEYYWDKLLTGNEPTNFKLPCTNTCYNYDLRYYRQFNLGSVWTNVFKIVPEVNDPRTRLPPGESFPDARDLCLQTRPGKYVCSKDEIGEECDTPDDCIPGLDCVTPLDAGPKVCCPAGTYFENNCCRQEPSGACTTYEATCPADLRSPPKGRWPEYTGEYEAWLKESPKGLRRDYDYLLGVGEEGCESDADCATYLNPEDYTEEEELHCSMALGDDGAWPTADVIGNHCCPEEYEYDISFNCCMPEDEAVRIVRMHDMSNIWRNAEGTGAPVDTGYCEERYLETGKKCRYEEGPCRMVNRLGDRMDYDSLIKECDGDLQCKQNYANTYVWDTACCRQEQMWNGKNCVPLLTQAPWVATWTRTMPGVAGDGGGPIWIYSGAGAMIPNMTEAAGWMDRGTLCRRDGRFRTELDNGYPLYWLGCRAETSPASTDAAGNSHPEMQRRGVCRYCDGAWPYQCNPSPIWFEARNFGNDYRAGWRQTTCNGDYDGIDASVYPFDKYDSTTVDPLFRAPFKLECWGKDCNCGRDMDGNSIPRNSPWPAVGSAVKSPLDTVGDQADGNILDGGSWDPKDPQQPDCRLSGIIFSHAYINDGAYRQEDSKVSCTDLQSTSCKRGRLDPKTVHRCNYYVWGHGSFLNATGLITSNTTVNPYKTGTFGPGEPWNGVDAKEIVPEVCGRIQRKEVAYDINNVGDRYYPKYPGDAPESWFDYVIEQYDGNYAPLAPIVRLNVEPGRINILPKPASPWTVLRDNRIMVELDTATRYINVSLNYTVRNRIERQDFVKQCSWVGCSRIEEEVTTYDKTECQEQCDGSWSCTDTNNIVDGPPPCCCTPQDRNDPAVKIGGRRECVVDRRDPMARGDCWACKTEIMSLCALGSTGGRFVSYAYDSFGNLIGENRALKYREEHDCTCEYACWGCWHLNGETDYMPVTEDDPAATTAYNNQRKVREQINESARVEARPYGNHIRVENPITSGDSEAKVKVRGRIIYGYPNVDMDTIPDALEKKNTFMSGFLTFQAVDDETGKIDMFSGVRISVPDIVTLDLFTRRFPLYHELSGLKSTLPHDYVNVTAGQRKLLRLSDICYYRQNPSTQAYEYRASASPFYLRWLFNSAKQYTAYYDIFQGHGTHYNLEGPVWLADLGNTRCKNFLDERSANIPLYRTYHENEPLAYDFESVFVIPVDIEAGLRFEAYNPSSLANVKSIAYKKSVEKVYARYAPSCSLPPESGYSLTGAGDCPDMCSDIAEPKGGGCDCEYREPYRKRYPISEDVCKMAADWRMSELFRCEGAPGKYKSFCADGKYYAYWEDQYQFRYRWNAGTDSCEIDMLKECEPKEFPPESYTIIFQNPKTLTFKEWNTAIAKVYSNLRNVEYKAFGDQDPCASQTYTHTSGGLDVSIEKPKPVYYELTGGDPVPETAYTMTVTAKSPCGGGVPSSGKRSIYVEFQYPYAYATGWYAEGDTITVIPKKGTSIVAVSTSLEDGGFTKSIKYITKKEVEYATPMCDYLMDNVWLLIVIWVMVMSYRFFGERMSDFKEWFDEYKGKK